MRQLNTLRGYNDSKIPVDAYFPDNAMSKLYDVSKPVQGTAVQKLLPKED